jgi:hypothetical protein
MGERVLPDIVEGLPSRGVRVDAARDKGKRGGVCGHELVQRKVQYRPRSRARAAARRSVVSNNGWVRVAAVEMMDGPKVGKGATKP